MKSLLNSVQIDSEPPIGCGPAAVSAITGAPFSLCVDLLMKVMKRRDYISPNGGWPSFAMEDACAVLGYELIEFSYRGPLIKLRPFSLSVIDEGDGHYVVTHLGRMVDSGNENPILIRKTRFRKSTVRYGWHIIPPIRNVIQPASKSNSAIVPPPASDLE